MKNYFYLLLLVFACYQPLNAHGDVLDEARKFAGVYRLESCVVGNVRAPLTIAVQAFSYGVEISIKDAILPARKLVVEKFGKLREPFKNKNQWGCYKGENTSTFEPGKMEIGYRSRFYNLCLVPEIGSSQANQRTYFLEGDRLRYREKYRDRSGPSEADCLLVRE